MLNRITVPISFAIMLSCLFHVSAQEADIQSRPPLSSQSLILIVAELPNVESDRELARLLSVETREKNEKPKNDGMTVALDFPVFSSGRSYFFEKRIMIDSRLIAGDNPRLGGTSDTQKEFILAKYEFVPKLNVYSRDFRAQLSGGIFENKDNKRKIGHAESSIEYGLWFALVGIDGFFEKENFLGVLEGQDFRISFGRVSYGGGGFLGFKFGDFQKSFLAGKFKRGYIFTEAEEIYKSSITSVGPIKWYGAEFKMDSISLESRLSFSYVAPYFSVEGKKYKRMVNRDGIFPLGINNFRELTTISAVEVTPSLKHDFIRFVVSYRRDFGRQDGLLIVSDPSEFQVFARLAF